MKKNALFLVLAALTLPVSGQGLVKLKLGVLPYLSSAILKIAVDEGYFREQGLDVEMVPTKGSVDTTTGLIKGQLDAASLGFSASFFSAVTQGVNLKMVMPTNVAAVAGDTSFAFVARKSDVLSGKYSSPASLKGARVVTAGVPLTFAWFFLAQYLKSGGLTMDDISSPMIDASVQPQALANGQIDIAVMTEPSLSRMLARPDLAILLPAEPLFPGYTLTAMVYGARLLKDRELAIRFTMALLKANRQYLEGKTPRNVKHVVALTGLDETTVRNMRWTPSSPDGVLNPASILPYEKWLQEQGALDRILPVNDVFDPTLVTAALARLGTQP